jgi:hypothetical protein
MEGREGRWTNWVVGRWVVSRWVKYKVGIIAVYEGPEGE